MRDQKRTRPAPAATGRGAENEHGKALTRKRNTPEPKVWRAIRLLSTGRRVHRWDAAREIHDSCWNSTVAELQGRMGLHIARKEIVVCGYAGAPTRCFLYWLEPTEQEKAEAMLRARYGRHAEGAA